MTKTVIFVWTTNPCNIVPTNNYAFWGIGDIIRGIFAVNEICLKYGYDFFIDFQKHQIKNFLKENIHPFTSHVESSKDIPFIFPGKVETYITESKDDIVMLVTNEIFKNPIPSEIKLRLKNILTPNDTFQMEIENKISELPKNYEVLHFRMGDDYLVRNGNNINLEHIISKIERYFNQNTVIVTDNAILKDFLIGNEKYNNNILNTGTPCHIGIQNDLPILKNTLIDFFIVTRSTKILSYSVYSWISGFVKIPSDLYDIPMKII